MDKYIKQLLQQDSKVILPQFGAIVLADEETGSLMFNQYLTYDDGKIIEAIGKEENIDPEAAKSKIQNLIQEIKTKIDKGDSYSLGDLGVFSKDDDNISFKGNLKGGVTPPSEKKTPEVKSTSSKENVYIEKKDGATTSKDKVKEEKKKEDTKSKAADKLKIDQQKADKERIKKEKIEKKKAAKEQKIKAKEERKKKKLEEKTKRKAEKERLKKEKADKKKEAAMKSKTVPEKKKEVPAKEAPKPKTTEEKTSKVIPVTPIPAKEEPKKSVPAPENKVALKNEIANKKKAEKEKRIKEKEERKKKKLEEKNKRRAEKERLKQEKSKKVTPQKSSVAATTPIKQDKKVNDIDGKPKKEGGKRKPVFWILLVLILLVIGGGIWVGLNYEKVETFMGWNKFEKVDVSKDVQVTAKDNVDKETEESLVVIDSLDNDNTNDSISEALQPSETAQQPKVDKKKPASQQPIASSTGAYHIIVGGFHELNNATNMVENLKGQGFNSKMLEGTYTGLELHLVAAQSYPTLNDAKADLQRIKQEVNDGAWIFKK